MIHVHTGVFIISALLLLSLPLDWLAAVALSSLFHEFCHILALLLLNGKIRSIKVQLCGCIIESSPMEPWKQFCSILAGPAGSFLLLFLCRTVPKIAICGLLQGLYNLIPLLPLDGGRLMRLLLDHVCHEKADRVMSFVAFFVSVLFILFAAWLIIYDFLNPWTMIIVLCWNIRMLLRKIPCKQSEIGVQ